MAWEQDIPRLQAEVGELLQAAPRAAEFHALLEYELPDEDRPDLLVLANGLVVVVELKGKAVASRADIDKAAAYVRDLRCYHRECHQRTVRAIVVPTHAIGVVDEVGQVVVAGPDALDWLLARWSAEAHGEIVDGAAFLDESSFQPAPSLVQAARELFTSGAIRELHRARAATEPAIERILRITDEAARTKARRLVIVRGGPGTGKTLVGLRVVHHAGLDGHVAEHTHAPAIYLSGNAPLIQVLQYQMRAVGGGKVFVRDVKPFLKRHAASARGPTEHVLVFDEAQRAWDAGKVGKKHRDQIARSAKSEPQLLLEIAARIPDWAVVVALVGAGQEIHDGEEGGLPLWAEAARATGFSVDAPTHDADTFREVCQVTPHRELNLDTELRFHAATGLHEFVDSLLRDGSAGVAKVLAANLATQGYELRLTRDFGTAKDHLRSRYHGLPDRRFGVIASSRDAELRNHGVSNEQDLVRKVPAARWFVDGEEAAGERSCRHLRDCLTEFQVQGLELDACLIAWGTDLLWEAEAWTNRLARRYATKSIRSALELRRNAYRVLLTRAREGVVVFVPQVAALDRTHARLVEAGFLEI